MAVPDPDKSALRAHMKRVRALIAPDACVRHSEELGRHVGSMPLTPLGIVSGYLPIGDELDPRPLMALLMADGHRLCMPVMAGRGKPLSFRTWTPSDAMNTVAWGIQEPKADKPTVIPDIMLVPLLAIDRAGNRLGYGAGFYDRTIAEARQTKPVTTIGLAFDAQIIDAVPHTPTDVPLDWILTPSGFIQCQAAA